MILCLSWERDKCLLSSLLSLDGGRGGDTCVHLFCFWMVAGVLCGFCLIGFVVFEIGSLHVVMAVLELFVQPRLASDSQRFPCLCFQGSGITGLVVFNYFHYGCFLP